MPVRAAGLKDKCTQVNRLYMVPISPRIFEMHSHLQARVARWSDSTRAIQITIILWAARLLYISSILLLAMHEQIQERLKLDCAIRNTYTKASLYQLIVGYKSSQPYLCCTKVNSFASLCALRPAQLFSLLYSSPTSQRWISSKTSKAQHRHRQNGFRFLKNLCVFVVLAFSRCGQGNVREGELLTRLFRRFRMGFVRVLSCWPLRKGGDAHSHGRSRRCWQNNHSLQT